MLTSNIFEKEEFEYAYGTSPFIKHIPKLKDKGEPIAFYVVAKLNNGATLFNVMSIEDCIEHGKKHSKTFDKTKKEFDKNSPWVKDRDAMCKKTVLIQIMKLLPKSVEMQKALAMDNTTKSKIDIDMFNIKDETKGRQRSRTRVRKNVIPESVILKRPGAELAIDPNTGKTLCAEDALMPYEFLDEIIVDFEKMQRELDVLKTQISNYSENMNNYREKELSLNNVMLSAQRFADQLTVDAERKAAEIIANAEREAEKIVGSTQEKYNQVLADYAMLANRYNDAKETLRDYFRTQLTILDQDEAGIATEQVAEYIKQAEQLPQAVAEAEKKAMAENEETKLNVKLKEIMENTMVSEPAAE